MVDCYIKSRATCVCDHITDNELRWERLDLALVLYGLLYQIFFSTLLNLKADVLNFLHIHLSCMCETYSLKCGEAWLQRAHPDNFLYFAKAHCFVVIINILKYTLSRLFAVSNDTLFVFLWSKCFVVFLFIFDRRRLIIVTVIKFQAVLDWVCCNRNLRAVE